MVEKADNNYFICNKLPSSQCSSRNQKSTGVASCFMIFLMLFILLSITALLLLITYDKILVLL